MFPGGGELLLIVIAVLLLFGGRELPRFMRILGQWSAMLRRSLNEVRREFNRIGIQQEMEEAARSIRETASSRPGDANADGGDSEAGEGSVPRAGTTPVHARRPEFTAPALGESDAGEDPRR